MFQSDDCIRQNGFFQIKCNGFIYGEIYGSELEEIVDKEPLYDWFERMLRTVKELEVRHRIFLSDTESYNTWIEFCKGNGFATVRLVTTENKEGLMDMEFHLKNAKSGALEGQEIPAVWLPCHGKPLPKIYETDIQEGKAYVIMSIKVGKTVILTANPKMILRKWTPT